MASWVQRLVRRQKQDPRDVLLAAMTDFGDSALASRAVAFYDDPQHFEAFLVSSNLPDGPWTEHERAPMLAELTSEIFIVLLLEEHYMVHVEWDNGGDAILDAYDRLFSRSDLAKFTDVERQEAARICARSRKRGDPLLMLFDHLHAAAETRGRKVVHFHLGQADQFPALLTPEAYRRWARWNAPKFGKGFPVIRW